MMVKRGGLKAVWFNWVEAALNILGCFLEWFPASVAEVVVELVSV